jgi:hypothetical protein
LRLYKVCSLGDGRYYEKNRIEPLSFYSLRASPTVERECIFYFPAKNVTQMGRADVFFTFDRISIHSKVFTPEIEPNESKYCSAAKYIPGHIHVCHVSYTGACHTTLFQNTLLYSPLRGRNLDVHLAMNSLFSVLRCRILTRKTLLKPLRLLKQIQPPARAVAVSLAFSEEYTSEKVEEVAVQQRKPKRRQIGRNRDARQLRLFSDSRRFIFPSRKRRNRTLGYSTEQKVAAALRVLGYAEALDQPDHFLRRSEESIRQSFLRSTQHTTEVYARPVKLPTNEDAKVISQRFAGSCRHIPSRIRSHPFVLTFGTCQIRIEPNFKTIHPVVI